MKKLEILKYIVIDVDGTMTDGSIYYDCNGNEFKKFNTRDAAAFFCMNDVGIQTIVVTGRECFATERRLAELGVKHLYQNIKNKKVFLDQFVESNDISYSEMGYIGDDLNDYDAMEVCGFRACPKNACEEIRELVDYVSDVRGGEGAVRDIAEYLLKARKQWDKAIRNVYGCKSIKVKDK